MASGLRVPLDVIQFEVRKEKKTHAEDAVNQTTVKITSGVSPKTLHCQHPPSNPHQ